MHSGEQLSPLSHSSPASFTASPHAGNRQSTRQASGRVSELRGENITLGRFVDQSDSYHLYGSYFREFGDGFLKLLFDRENFEDRTWTTEFAAPIFEEAKEIVKRKVGGV